MNLISSDDPILHTPTESVDISKENHLIKELTKILKKENAIGIAAPQVGESKNLFLILDITTNQLLIFANTEIYQSLTEVKTSIFKEGCLSFPNLVLNIERPNEIIMKYTTITSRGVDLKQNKFNGFLARIIQHEYDHVTGITFDMRINYDKKIKS